MALHKSSGKIPLNAVELSNREAVAYQWSQIIDWPRKMDTWPFKWGLAGLGLMSTVTGVWINQHWRRKLRLRHHGSITTLLPMFLGPPLFTLAFHSEKVTSDLFLNITKCYICLQNKAVGAQLAGGIVYPVIMAPILTIMCANHFGTYKVPYWSNFRETHDLLVTMTKPILKRLLLVAFLQAVVAGFVTHQEAKSLQKIRSAIISRQENPQIDGFAPLIE